MDSILYHSFSLGWEKLVVASPDLSSNFYRCFLSRFPNFQDFPTFKKSSFIGISYQSIYWLFFDLDLSILRRLL
jgi:hypothetical protein